ncbi:MAG: hypothetical protein GY827_04640 [Cytophagales bacterium]|nr:hypothetical protein [Cytophagales bacterium]
MEDSNFYLENIVTKKMDDLVDECIGHIIHLTKVDLFPRTKPKDISDLRTSLKIRPEQWMKSYMVLYEEGDELYILKSRYDNFYTFTILQHAGYLDNCYPVFTNQKYK